MTAKTMADVLAEHQWYDATSDNEDPATGCTGCDDWFGSEDALDDGTFAAHQAAALSAAGFGLVADAKAEAKRDAAAAGVRAVCDVWGAGGRATVRLSELSEIAKDITEGEWDQHIEWNLKDIARERARATKAAS